MPKSKMNETDENFKDEKEFIRNILLESGVKDARILMAGDSIPFILSFSGISGSRFLAVSTGIINVLSEEERKILITREAHLMSRPDMGLFTAASFLPFALHVASSFFFESARMVNIHRRPGTTQLAGSILMGIKKILEFPLLFVSRSRHENADKYAIKTGTPHSQFERVVEKCATEFIKPVAAGSPFRKRIFEGLHLFLPFDPHRWQNLTIWRSFIQGDDIKFPLIIIGKILEEKNLFTKEHLFLSGHPSILHRFFWGKSIDDSSEIATVTGKIESLCKNTAKDRIAISSSVFLLLWGVILSTSFKGIFGLPFIAAAIGMAFRHFYFRKRERASDKNFSNAHSKFEGEGILRGFNLPERVDAPFFFLDSEDVKAPLILKQLYRSEEPLFFLQEKSVKITGTIRVEEIPFIEIKTIRADDEKNRPIRSAHTWIQGFIILALLIIGLLLIILEFMPRK